MSLETKLYKPLDEYIKKVKKKVKESFAPLYISGFDQLNIIQLAKSTALIYDEVDEFNREEFVKLVRHGWGFAEELMAVHLSEIKAKDFVSEYLSGYDPVTQYVYDKELDRKRMRLNESILTAKEYQDIVKLHKAVKKAADLLYTQGSQYALDILLSTLMKAYRDGGCKYLRWNTQEDEKVCRDCHDLDGKVFRISEYPEPQHYNCRCYPTPASNPD